MVFAEQHWIDAAILWSPPGLDRSVLQAVVRLREFNRDMRIIVITPKFTTMGKLGFVENLQVDAYLLDSNAAAVVEAATGVPAIIERDQTPPTSHGGSSAAQN
jgi:hypothetical protein